MRLERGETMLLGAVLLCCVAAATAKAVQKREVNPDLLFQEKAKRPFCNAFTGCGRKRSDLSLQDAMAPGMEMAGMGPRPASVAEARLWDELLARIESVREQQMAPAYLRGRRSVQRQDSPAATPQEPEVATKR